MALPGKKRNKFGNTREGNIGGAREETLNEIRAMLNTSNPSAESSSRAFGKRFGMENGQPVVNQSKPKIQLTTPRSNNERDMLRAEVQYKNQVAAGLSTEEINDRSRQYQENLSASRGEVGDMEYKLGDLGAKLEKGEAEIQRAVDKYNADKTENNRRTVENLLATYQTNLDAYKSTVDEYNHYYSLDGYKERAEAQDKEVKALTEERDKLKMYLDGVQSGTWVPDQAFLDRVSGGKPLDEALEEVQGRLADAALKASELNELYYEIENQSKRTSLDADERASGFYTDAQILDDDLKKVSAVMAYVTDRSGDPAQIEEYKAYLKDKYGLDQKAIDQYAISGAGGAYTPRTDGGYNTIYELYRELEQKKTLHVAELERAGYDYERMSGYEQMQRDRERYEKNIVEWEDYAKEHPILASIDTVLVAPFQGVDYLKTMASGIGHSDHTDVENYVPMNVYNMDATNYVNTVRATVSKTIEENTDWELFGQNMSSFLYQTGMSLADSMTQVYAFGPAAVWLMGASAASSQAKYVIERGGTNEQAFWGGLAAGAAEVLFEKIGIDNLLKPKNIASVKDFLWEATKQAGLEASEEMLTEISNILTDAVIMADKSDWAKMLETYKAQGMSNDQATKQAFLDCVAQVAWAGAGGFVSGSGSSAVYTGPRTAIQQVQVWAHDNMTGRQLKQASVNFSMVEQALSYAEDSETYRMASDMAQRLNTSTTDGADSVLNAIKDSEYGRLARLMTAELETKGPSGVQNQVEAAQAARPEEKVASPTMQAFLEAGDTVADAEVKAGVLDRILSGDTTLTNTQLRKLKLNTQASRTVFEKLTGVSVPKTTDTKTLIATARSAAEQAVVRKTAAVDTAARQEATAHAKGAPVSTDSAAAAWRSAQSAEQSQESFMAQLEREAELAAQEVEAKAAPTEEPASAFMPRDGAGRGASFVAQLEQEAAETAQQAEAKAAPTASEPAAAFTPKTAATPAAQQSKGKTRSVKSTLSSLVKEIDARAHTMETADGQKVTYQKFWDAYTAQHQDAKAEEVLDAFLEGGKVFEDTMRRSKTDRRRYSASETGAKTAGLGQTQAQAKPTREQEWTAKYATAMLRGTSVKNVRVAFEGFSGQENAYYQDGEIVLNGNRLTTQRAINYILGHELTHPGADADADLVQSILDVGDSLLGSEVMSTRLSMTRERYIRSYMRNHGMSRTQAEAKVTLKLAKEETAADLMSELFETPGAMERMGRESTGAKVLRAARDALNRMLSKLTGENSQSARNEAEMLLERLNRALRSQESRGTMEQKEARSSVGGETDSPDYRGRQDAGRAGGGGQVRGEYRGRSTSEGRYGRGDLEVLERALIPSDVRAAAEQNDFPNLELREILDPAAFSGALERAKAANPNGGMVDSQSVEHLDETKARTFMREDGLAGVAVEADGNIVGVFKHPNFKQRKVVKDLLLTAIAQGGTHLDCYVTGSPNDLAMKYTQMGFVPVAWLAFNREYAPDGWNYEAWGEPDVVMWVHSGETALEVAQRSGTYPFFSTEYIHSLPQFDDYDAAKELQAQKVKEITEARKTGRRYSISSAQSFEDQVSTALTEDVSENRDRALYIRDTPLALRDVGLGDLPMAITAKHIQDIHHAEDPSGQHPEWHGISKNTLNRLPDLLSRPILIMDSATTTGDIVVVVEAIDPKARPVVVSIHPNGTARVDGQRGPANFITSVYGRNGYTAWVNQAVRDGRVLYWHKNRSQNLSGTARVQFPAGLTGLASNTIIKRHAGYVKDNIPERRFSVGQDSEGRELSAEQQEFFKDSKVRDENGNLLVMYHGTTQGGFTEFMVSKHTGYFFADSRTRAASYSGRGKTYAPPRQFKSWEEAIQFVEREMGDGQFLSYDADSDTYLFEDGEYSTEYDNDESDLEQFAKDIADVGDTFSAIYPVYLNLKDPLIIDGAGANWDSIPDPDGKLLSEMTEEERKNVQEVNDYGDKTMAVLMASDRTRFTPDGFPVYPKTTNEWAEEAKDMGYDGVIFENITDDGGFGYGAVEGRVVVAFDANQIKLVNNPTPTDDPDIRYSVSDEERIFITPRGIEVVKNPTSTEYQQMRDEIYDAFPWLRGTGEPVFRHTYDEEGNEYYWRADQGLHSQVEPYINRHYHTRTSQQWQWWLSPYKDEYPTDYDRRFSVSDEGLPESDVERYNRRVILDPGTIDRYLKDYAAKSSPRYAQAYIAYMYPDDFLSLTTSSSGREIVEMTSRALDTGELGEASRHQPLQLHIDHESGEVTGHEGRHRAVALSRSGVAQMPVLLFDSTNKYSKEPIDLIKLTGQDFGSSRSYDSVYVHDLMPLSYENRDQIVQKFATMSVAERISERRGRKTVRYSVSDDDINPDTGYRRGSIEDSFMRIVNAGDEQRALDMLQSMLERMAAFEATRAERSNPADAFMPKPELTDDLVAKNRAAIQSLIDKYGRMEQTKAAARRVNFPNQIDDDTKVRGVIRTAASAKATPEALVSEFERSILDGDAGYTYVPISDKSVLDKIKGRIERRGFAAELREWRNKIDSNQRLDKEDIALGEQLYVEACANKDLETAQQLVAELAMVGTQYGQVIQAISMLHKLSPTGQLYYLQKTVEHMTREYDKLGKDIDVLIDPELAKQLLEASTKEEVDVAMDQIIADIARQLPVTIWDKWDAWRYLAMLGNPTTHIRNFIGNAVFTPVRMTKDLVGIALETMFIRDRGQRTKGFATKEAREFAKADALVMQDILRTGGKHNITDRIREAKQIFNFKALEWARIKNTAALEAEDWIFLRRAYVNALSGFLSARGVDLSTLQGEGETREGRRLLNEARAYAVREAQKATYRDMNTMASILNQFRRAKNPFVRFAFGGLLPFTKTPFNIVRRGVEYSPLGLIGTLRTALTGGSAAEILDRLSASFTGTGLMVAGYFLAKAGLLIGGIGDDPEDEFQKLQGVQAYSFQWGDNNYTIDWLAPTVLPLFVGAELHRLTEGDAEAEDAYEAMMTILEPVMALSMMSGLNDTLAAVRYEDQEEMVVAMLRNMVGSYFTQGVPTILGRIARTMDDSRRTSFVSADAAPTESWLSRTFQSSVLGKIPVAAEGRMLYIDAWGRTDTQENAGIRALENFLSPGYYNEVRTTAVDEELMRLAEATNSTAVFPKRAEKSFTVGGEDYAMTQEEYQEHLIERGQTSYQLVSDLISSPAYAGMSDDEKALAVKKCYDYAAQLAKLHTNSDYNANPWVVKLEQMTKEGLDADDYFTAYAMSENQDQNMKEIISSTDRYDGATAAMLMAMDFDADDFTDPYASRYEYKLTDGQRETYRGLFVERLSSELSYLMSDDWYLDASVEERLEMLDETWSDVKDEVKRDMADWLWDHGIESTEKE